MTLFPKSRRRSGATVAAPRSVVGLTRDVLYMRSNRHMTSLNYNVNSFLITRTRGRGGTRCCNCRVGRRQKTVTGVHIRLLNTSIRMRLYSIFGLMGSGPAPGFSGVFSGCPFKVGLQCLKRNARCVRHLSEGCPNLSGTASSS